jgi:hypothetical protein
MQSLSSKVFAAMSCIYNRDPKRDRESTVVESTKDNKFR